jgi:hypothetical protein
MSFANLMAIHFKKGKLGGTCSTHRVVKMGTKFNKKTSSGDTAWKM